jgi:hypothetical protein
LCQMLSRKSIGTQRGFAALLVTRSAPVPIILQHFVGHGARAGDRRTVGAGAGMRDARELTTSAGIEVQAAAKNCRAKPCRAKPCRVRHMPLVTYLCSKPMMIRTAVRGTTHEK